MYRRALVAFVLNVMLFATMVSTCAAQSGGTGSVRGTVLDEARQPIAAVQIVLRGQTTQSALTDQSGAFTFDAVLPGVYTVDVTRAGFTPTRQDIAVVSAGATVLTLALSAASLSSIQTIGRVSVRSDQLNTSTAAIATMGGESFIDQGQLNVVRALNQLPGVQVGLTTNFNPNGLLNGASPVASGLPSVRGALPYETESLIDGHPINIGQLGTFNPAFISPYILQNVEVAKGPGAQATNIFNAIGGTINYRTLEPTRTPEQSIDAGVDQWGGQFGNLRATGTTANGRFAYALDYATQGTKGFDRGFDPTDPMVNFSPGTTVNGQVACGNPNATGCNLGVIGPGDPNYRGNPNYENAIDFVTPFMACCQNIPMGSDSRNELAKLRYNFTPSTSLTFTYLGGQQRADLGSGFNYMLPNYYFTPPAGYTGAYPAFTELPIDTQYTIGGSSFTNVNLYSVDFRTAVGPVSLNARYYIADDYDGTTQGIPNGQLVFSEQLYGGIPLGNNLTPTIFNGTEATISEPNSYSASVTSNRLYGLTAQATVPFGVNILSVSYDSVKTQSFAAQYLDGPTNFELFPGSGQQFQTVAAQAQFQLAPALSANLSNYATLYTNHYTQDFGNTFIDSTHAYDVPRLSFAWRASPAVAVRAATGYSVTAPYLSLLENSAAMPAQYPVLYATVTNNAGSIRPETAFGFDFGADVKVARDTTVSADVYQTTLRDQFLTTTTLSPAPYVLGPNNPYSAIPGSYPLYITQTENLGHSRFEGIEFALTHDPERGFGYKLQGSLQRAFTYDLPAGFYDTAAGPNTTNLGVLPNVNFSTSGDGYNGLSFTQIPYSQGYGEINYRLKNGALALLGATYYGSNNSYGQPAFAVVNGSYRQPIGQYFSLLLAVSNITSAYSNFYPNDFGGIPVPLIDGKVGYNIGNVVGPSTASLTLRVNF